MLLEENQPTRQTYTPSNGQSVPPPEEHTKANAIDRRTVDVDRHGFTLPEWTQTEHSSPPALHSSPTIAKGYKDNTFTVPDLSNQVTRTRADAVFVGNCSLVFIGEWDGSMVAIKVIREIGTIAAMKRKVRREKEIWASLKHENIVPLYGFCEGHAEFGAYGALISPWYRNGHSAHYIRQNCVPAPPRFKLWADIIRGMVYLHSHHPVLVHGDLKTMNVLIDDDGHARICDFGLVRILLEDSSGLTTTTTHTGTVRYLAHELVVSDQPLPTVASDVHAIGCIGLDLIFLTPPYASRKTHAQIFGDIGRVPPATKMPIPAPIESVALGWLWNTLDSCWNINPRARPSAHQPQEFVAEHGEDITMALEDGSDGSLTRYCG